MTSPGAPPPAGGEPAAERRTSVWERRAEIEAPLDPERYSAFRRLATDERHRLVVSLGGGAVPGLCGNVALARILEELDLRPHVHEIWGTSAGAIVGAALASDVPAMDVFELVKSLNRRGSIDVSWLRIASGFLLRPFRVPLPDGLVRGKHFIRTIDRGLRAKTFEECSIPFRCIACTDDGTNQRKIFREGPLLPAIVASMSLPGILAPRHRGDEVGYYDGGLVEKTPLISPIAEHARSGDERKLLLVCSHFGTEAHRGRARGFVARFLHTLYALEDVAWSYQHAEARSKANVVLILLDPHLGTPSAFDFSRAEHDYLQAREFYKDLLQNAKLALTFGLS